MDEFLSHFESSSKKKEIVDIVSSVPSNYIGSKRRLLSHIWDVLEQNNVEFESVFDAFSGSGLVSLLFKHMGKKVVCNDLLTSSAITAVCLLQNNEIPLTPNDLTFLCKNIPEDCGTFVLDNYKDKFFTEKECKFLDRYKKNVELLCGKKFYCGLEVLKQATLASIPNSNFSIYGKDLRSLRSTHTVGQSYWTERWRDTTRKRRDDNNEIMFGKALGEMYKKYKGAFSLFAIENHVNQHCFLGGRYYNGQTIAKLEHRLKHIKNDGQEIVDISVGKSLKKLEGVFADGDAIVLNGDIMGILEANMIETDLLYLDPPYGGGSSDYVHLYRFLEEYLYECKLEEMEHIVQGGKRFVRGKQFREEFEHMLSLCGGFKTWLISYNESSFANIDTITSIIKNAGRSNIKLHEVPITYQYRKGKNKVAMSKFNGHTGFDPDADRKYLERGIEYLILAR